MTNWSQIRRSSTSFNISGVRPSSVRMWIMHFVFISSRADHESKPPPIKVGICVSMVTSAYVGHICRYKCSRMVVRHKVSYSELYLFSSMVSMVKLTIASVGHNLRYKCARMVVQHRVSFSEFYLFLSRADHESKPHPIKVGISVPDVSVWSG